MATLSGLEPELSGPKPLVLPLHHRVAKTTAFEAPLFICFRRLFAFGQIPIGKIFGGYLQVATLKSSCIVLFAHVLKIHPLELIEIPLSKYNTRAACFFQASF